MACGNFIRKASREDKTSLTHTHTHNPLFNKTNWTTLKHTDLCCLPFILLNMLTASCSLLLGDLHLPALLSV